MEWPQVKKKSGLQRRELKALQLFTIDNYLTKAESEAFIKAAEQIGFQHQGSLGPSKGEAFRDNDRISLQSPELAETLWKAGLSTLFKDIKVNGKLPAGLNSNIRFYRYKPGQRFGQHIDESVELENGESTEYTLLVYLNTGAPSTHTKSSVKKGGSGGGELVGGETVFYTGRRKSKEVVPVTGMALLHLHGDECLLHEAKAVEKGVKYVLRSDVVFSAVS